MKLLIFVCFWGLFNSFTGAYAAQKLRIPRLRTVGVMTTPVLAQTTPVLAQRRNGMLLFKKYYIAKQKEGRYEFGLVQYECQKSTCEQVGQSIALQFYKECHVLEQKGGGPLCQDLQSARIDILDPSTNSNKIDDRLTWYYTPVKL